MYVKSLYRNDSGKLSYVSPFIIYGSKYEIRSFVLSCGIFERYKYIRNGLFHSFYSDLSGDSILFIKESYHFYKSALCDFEREYSHFILKECERIWSSHFKRVERLRKRIYTLLKKPCIFLTLTFTDSILNSTSSDTRRRYVSRWLKSCGCTGYVGNIDFGCDNEYFDRKKEKRKGTNREHYHAVVQAETVDYNSYKYGRIHGERIRLKYDEEGLELSNECLPKYLAKLTNHAIKSSTKNSVILYSR